MLGSTIKKMINKKPYQGLYKNAADFYGISSEQFFKGIQEESLNINYTKHGGQNALWYSNLKETELLISKGILINQLNEDKENALFSNVNLTTAKLYILLQSGININQQNYILRTALFNRNKEITEMLFNANIDINLKDDYGTNALFSTEVKSAIFLVEKNIDITIKDKFQRNIFFYIEDQELFKKINEKNLVDLNQIDENYDTPLFHNRYLVYFFTEAGMNIDYVNPIGRNALFYNQEIKHLINSGINLKQEDIYGDNALFHQSFINCIYLIESGLSPNSKNRDGVKYIDYALQYILNYDDKDKHKQMILNALEKYEKMKLKEIVDSTPEDNKTKKRL